MSAKEQRIQSVLIALIELYLKIGKPIASQTLKDECFPELSSATIRNYFTTLEEEDYLTQQHASAGRIPTEKAFRTYVDLKRHSTLLSKEDQSFLSSLLFVETREIASFLNQSVEALSSLARCPVFLTAPRFDRDRLKTIRLVELDAKRYLAALISDFGTVETELFFSPKRFSSIALRRLEEWLTARLTGSNLPALTDNEEASFATHLYNELALRHIVHYTTFNDADIYRAGFARLLEMPEFHDPSLLSETLALFEKNSPIRRLLAETLKKGDLCVWLGSELAPYMRCAAPASLIAIPYMIDQKRVGTLAFLGPDRQDYARLFAISRKAAELIGQTLSQSIARYEISFREPLASPFLETHPQWLLENSLKPFHSQSSKESIHE